MSARSCPAIIISAPASGQGKTIFTAALARYHRKQGKKAKVFKIGPDFLDPMILEVACGQKVKQLDLWMMGENYCRHLLYEAALEADLILIEGVMGLFDGQPSTADLASLFKIPVLTLIDVRGMGETFHSLAYGLSHYRPDLLFYGAIANGAGSTRHKEILEQSRNKQIKYLGALNHNSDNILPSRHLGLLQATEIKDLNERLDNIATAIAKADLAIMPEAVEFYPGQVSKVKKLLSGKKIAIAQDKAFSFIYEDNLSLLEEMGASINFFSPLTDHNLPDCDALYLPGGYPELHLQELTSNIGMKNSICKHFNAGRTIYAECGGMMFLCDSITNANGEQACMLGLLPGKVMMQNKLAALGYQSLPLPMGELRGHTFHYSYLETKLIPLAQAKKKADQSVGESVYKLNNLHASYLHCYFRSDLQATACLF